MTSEEKIEALLSALVYYVKTVGGVDASFVRQGLKEAGLIDYRPDKEYPGRWKVIRRI